jgi:hypothetical protein
MGVKVVDGVAESGRVLIQHTCRDCEVEILRVWTSQVVDLRLQCHDCAAWPATSRTAVL